MQLLNGSRRSGKSLALIKYVGEKDLIIVCHNQGSCNYIKSLAEQRKINLKYEPITIRRYMKIQSEGRMFIDENNKLTNDKSCTPYYGGFVCDNLENCLVEIGLKFNLATGTIPTTHPSNVIIFEDNKKLIAENNLKHKIIGEFDYE